MWTRRRAAAQARRRSGAGPLAPPHLEIDRAIRDGDPEGRAGAPSGPAIGRRLGGRTESAARNLDRRPWLIFTDCDSCPSRMGQIRITLESIP